MSEEQCVWESGEETQRWEMTCGVCETDGAEGATVYGVRVTAGERVWTFDDVDASARRVEELLCLLREEQPSFCHLEDIVLDFIDRDER